MALIKQILASPHLAITRIVNGLHGLFLGHPVEERKEILQHKIALTDIGIAAEVSGGCYSINEVADRHQLLMERMNTEYT